MSDLIVTGLAIVGGYTVVGTVLSIAAYFMGNRTGNSGRYKHWSDENER